MLSPSPYKVPISNIPPSPNRGPCPLSLAINQCVNGDIAAEDKDDPDDEHARECGGKGDPGSAFNPGFCRQFSTLLTDKL